MRPAEFEGLWAWAIQILKDPPQHLLNWFVSLTWKFPDRNLQRSFYRMRNCFTKPKAQTLQGSRTGVRWHKRKFLALNALQRLSLLQLHCALNIVTSTLSGKKNIFIPIMQNITSSSLPAPTSHYVFAYSSWFSLSFFLPLFVIMPFDPILTTLVWYNVKKKQTFVYQFTENTEPPANNLQILTLIMYPRGGDRQKLDRMLLRWDRCDLLVLCW